MRAQAPIETGMEEALQFRLVQSILEAGQAGRKFHQDNREQWRPHLILSRWKIKQVAGLTSIPELQEDVPPVLVQNLTNQIGVLFAPARDRDSALIALAAQEPAGTAAVLGMGRGFDVPLLELALRYRSVVLVDLDEPNVRSAVEELRQELARLGFSEERTGSILSRVEIQIVDLSGIADRLEQFVHALPKPDAVRETVHFLHSQMSDPVLQTWPLKVDGTYDLVISSFVVSQISSGIVQYLQDAVTRSSGPLSQEEWIQFQALLQRFSAATAVNHAAHIAGLLNPGGKAYFSSESQMIWPAQGVQAPLFPVRDFLEAAQGTHQLALLPLGKWLWAQRMNGVFYPGAGYVVEAYQLTRSGLEEVLRADRVFATQP